MMADAAVRSAPGLVRLDVPVALVALRGYPLCWTIGMFQTALARLRGISAGRACADGRCAVGTSFSTGAR